MQRVNVIGIWHHQPNLSISQSTEHNIPTHADTSCSMTHTVEWTMTHLLRALLDEHEARDDLELVAEGHRRGSNSWLERHCTRTYGAHTKHTHTVYIYTYQNKKTHRGVLLRAFSISPVIPCIFLGLHRWRKTKIEDCLSFILTQNYLHQKHENSARIFSVCLVSTQSITMHK